MTQALEDLRPHLATIYSALDALVCMTTASSVDHPAKAEGLRRIHNAKIAVLLAIEEQMSQLAEATK